MILQPQHPNLQPREQNDNKGQTQPRPLIEDKKEPAPNKDGKVSRTDNCYCPEVSTLRLNSQ